MKRNRGGGESSGSDGSLTPQEKALLGAVRGRAEAEERRTTLRRLKAARFWTRTRRPDAKPQRQPYGDGLPPVINL